jgi:hypothetical protein
MAVNAACNELRQPWMESGVMGGVWGIFIWEMRGFGVIFGVLGRFYIGNWRF